MLRFTNLHPPPSFFHPPPRAGKNTPSTPFLPSLNATLPRKLHFATDPSTGHWITSWKRSIVCYLHPIHQTHIPYGYIWEQWNIHTCREAFGNKCDRLEGVCSAPQWPHLSSPLTIGGISYLPHSLPTTFLYCGWSIECN